jgi:hypothetical protein
MMTQEVAVMASSKGLCKYLSGGNKGSNRLRPE